MMRSNSRRAARDDVDVAVGQRVERAGVDGDRRSWLLSVPGVRRGASDPADRKPSTLSPAVSTRAAQQPGRGRAGLVPPGVLDDEPRLDADRAAPPRRAPRAACRFRMADRGRRCRTGRGPALPRTPTRNPTRIIACAVVDAAAPQVRRDQRQRPRVLLDEGDVRGATAQRLDARPPRSPRSASSTRAPRTPGASTLNSVSRSRSEVGRSPVASPAPRASAPSIQPDDDAHGRRTGVLSLSPPPPARNAAPSWTHQRRERLATAARRRARRPPRGGPPPSARDRAAGRRRAASGMPDWRVPKKSPGPRSSRSRSAITKPSVVSVSAFSRSRPWSVSGD